MSETLNVTVNKIIFPPIADQGDWYVIMTDKGKAVGKMKWRPDDGEKLVLNGTWGAYRGERNFKFTLAMPDTPDSPRDTLAYICSRAKGIGPAMEEAIWEAYGDDFREAYDGAIPRLNGDKYENFKQVCSLVDMETEKSKAIAWLMAHKASANLALAAWDEWEKESIGVVRANCYRLADLPHYGFTHVDGDIRTSFKIGDGDDRRVRAAILYSLGQLTANGSTVIDWTSLQDRTVHLIGIEHIGSIVDLTMAMFDDGSLIGYKRSVSVSLTTDYRNEKDILEFATQEAACAV